MKPKELKKSEKFFEFLLNDPTEGLGEAMVDLQMLGVDLNRIQVGAELLRKKFTCESYQSNESQELHDDWITQGRETREKVERVFRRNQKQLWEKYHSPQNLAFAIKRGEFGDEFQKRVSAFFRNQNFENLSDQDLSSFIEDCQLLGVWKKRERRK